MKYQFRNVFVSCAILCSFAYLAWPAVVGVFKIPNISGAKAVVSATNKIILFFQETKQPIPDTLVFPLATGSHSNVSLTSFELEETLIFSREKRVLFSFDPSHESYCVAVQALRRNRNLWLVSINGETPKEVLDLSLEHISSMRELNVQSSVVP